MGLGHVMRSKDCQEANYIDTAVGKVTLSVVFGWLCRKLCIGGPQ
jgi:hypothetical protein